MTTQTPIPIDGITILNPDEAAVFLSEHAHLIRRAWRHSGGSIYTHVELEDSWQTMPARALPALPDGVRIVILEDGENEQEIKAHRKTLKQLKQDGYTTVHHLFACRDSFRYGILDHGSIGQKARRSIVHGYNDPKPGQFVAFIAVNEALADGSWASAYGYDQLLCTAWEHADARRRGKTPGNRIIVRLVSGHIAYGFADHVDFRAALPQVVAACGQATPEAMTVEQARAQAKTIIASLVDDMAAFLGNMDAKTMRLNHVLAQLYHLTGDEHAPFIDTDLAGCAERPQHAEAVLDEALRAATIGAHNGAKALRDMIAVNFV